MISMKLEIIEALSQICDNIADSYPEENAVYPLIICLEKDNHVKIAYDSRESISYLRYKIDILDITDTTELALQVNQIMASLGFKRIICRDILEVNKKRKSLQFEALVDIENNYIYYNQENKEEK